MKVLSDKLLDIVFSPFVFSFHSLDSRFAKIQIRYKQQISFGLSSSCCHALAFWSDLFVALSLLKLLLRCLVTQPSILIRNPTVLLKISAALHNQTLSLWPSMDDDKIKAVYYPQLVLYFSIINTSKAHGYKPILRFI